MKLKKVLIVDIMGTDCTNNGVTSGKTDAYLLNDEGPFEVDIESENLRFPILELCEGPYNTINVKPINTGNKWYMFGGHFVYSSDSRFPSHQPIHVHDRHEG